MATLSGKITRKFPLLPCYISKFSQTNIYYLHSNDILYPSRDWVILSLRWLKDYLGRVVCWKRLAIPPISGPFR